MSFTSSRRDLTLVVAARAVSLLGDELAAITLLLRLQSHGAGAWAITALLIAAMAPLVLLAPLVGRLVDHRDNRLLLIASSLAQAALCTALAYANSTAAVLALVAALGAGQAVNGATWQALLPTIVGIDRLPRALGLSQSATTVAGILAPALGGVLTGWYGARVPLLLDAASFLAIALAAALMSTRRVLAPRDPSVRMRGGFAIVRVDPVLRMLLILLGVFITLGAMVNVVEVFLVRETLHSSASWYGLIGATWAVGLVGGSVAGGRLRGQSALAQGAVASATLLSLALALYAIAPTVAWLVPAAVLGGVGNAVLNLTTTGLVMLRTDEQARGRVAASVGALASSAQIGAYLLGGVLAGVLSPREVFAVAGCSGLLGPALFGRRLMRAAAPTPFRAAAVSVPA